MLAATLAESSPIVYVAIAGGIFFTVVWAYDAYCVLISNRESDAMRRQIRRAYEQMRIHRCHEGKRSTTGTQHTGTSADPGE